jgi:hypothetical protein
MLLGIPGIIIHYVMQADSDDLPATRAILRGLKKSFHTTNSTPIFIQVSGTGVLTDNAMGMYSASSVTSDLDIRKIEALPITQPHREVDVTIIEADKQGSCVFSSLSLTPLILGMQDMSKGTSLCHPRFGA